MSLNKNLRQELTALAQRCGEVFTEAELKEPDTIQKTFIAIRRRLETERSYAVITARKVNVPADVIDAPQTLQANRELLGERTLVKIDDLLRRASAQDARREEDARATPCSAFLPDYGLTCVWPSGHEDVRHFDASAGYWDPDNGPHGPQEDSLAQYVRDVLGGDIGDERGIVSRAGRKIASLHGKVDGLCTMLDRQLSELEAAMGCQLGEGATATYAERFDFLVKRGEKLREASQTYSQIVRLAAETRAMLPDRGYVLTNDQVRAARIALSEIAQGGRPASPQSEPAPAKEGAQLRLPEEPPVGTIVEVKGPQGQTVRWLRKPQETERFKGRCWAELEGDDEQVSDNHDFESWVYLWSLAISYRKDELPQIVVNPPKPHRVGEVIEWSDRDRLATLPRRSVVRGQGHGIAHREIGNDLKTLSWAIAGVPGYQDGLGRSWFPVTVLDVGMSA